MKKEDAVENQKEGDDELSYRHQLSVSSPSCSSSTNEVASRDP